MKCRIASAFALIVFVALTSFTAFGQVTSSLSGTVTDPNGAVVIGATVSVKNAASGSEFRTVTSNQGTYNVPSLGAGKYVVIMTASGFKSATVQDIEIDAGTPATVNVTLEVGQATETVVVQGGAQIVQTQTANISTTLNANQILNLPLVTRNPVNFVSTMVGVNTPRDVRNSTINGLPESAIDITLDGINVQDNFNKTTDGLFVRVAPTLDSIEEVTVSTSNPEAVGGAMGAVQVKFVTRSGGNEFHGSLYNYHRNTALNSAYWFTNRDTSYNVKAAKQCGDPNNSSFNTATMVPWTPDCRAPRAANLFHQFGGRVGGPIWIPGLFNGRNRAFFHVNYEEFRQPTEVVRQRTILHPLAQQGIFRYGSSGQVNLLDLAVRNNHTATIDPTIGKLLSDIRNATNSAGGITDLSNPTQQRFTYNPSGNALTKRPTVRFDWNVTDKHRVELSWTYQMGRGAPDFLNNVEPAFPGFPNQGQQPSDRYSGSLAVRSTLAPTLVNEARTGLSGGPSRFNPSASAGDFVGSVANQAGFNLGGAPGANATGIAVLGINGPTTVNAPSRRNPLFRSFSDTLTWSRGAHNLTFGGAIFDTQLTFNQQTLTPTINFGVDTNDPANAMFNTTNFPGASATDLNNARNLYAVLTGRITAINANARLVEETGQFTYLGNAFERSHQKEFGLFAQDSWRVNQNLTVNYGVRWEVARPFTVDNSSYTTATLDDIWGVSGPGNLFKPGTQTGRATQFIQMKEGTGAYNTDYTNFAPSLGFAWRIGAKDGWLKRIAGEGQTVVRGGYSMAYNREGIGVFRGSISSNPGVVITTNRSITLGNLGTLPVLFRERDRLGAPAFPTTPTYPLIGEPFVQVTNSVDVYDPNIKVPYSQSWTFGIQRELGKDTVIEARYVGTRNLGGWTTYNLNSVENNIVENGLLNEFKLAQANLRANIAAGRGNTFAYTGAPGTSPLPITLAYFSGTPMAQANNAALYTSSNFTSATFLNTLALNNPNLCCASTTANTAFGTSPSYAFSLDNNATFRDNALRAGLPANFMLTNPGLRGGANFRGNGGNTRYDALQIDLRRRLSNGLLVQANYQFAKTLESSRAMIPGTANPVQSSFRAPRVNILDTNTLRHAFKVSWVYELPIGRGKPLLGGAGVWLDRLVGGWEFHGAGRVQSGQLFNFGNVNLVGMTMDDLRKAFKLRFNDAAKVVYLLPQDIIDNTIRAFNASATSATGYGSLGAPTGRYLAPASNANCIQVYSGQCAPQDVFVTGPKFTRFDLSLKKQVRLTERFNFELRGEFLNAFNNINFFNPTANAFITPSSQTFMQVTTAYTDSANTNDPGGRLVQIVARFNF
ncbi:MAG: TonB-dependent receptor [Acidobacteria bacterium]|nr:TonB-dependent receptor [Acidobacteriota bacterium]